MKITKMLAVLALALSLLPLAGLAAHAKTTVKSKAKIVVAKSHGRKGGYVHATTYKTKTGKVVHRKAYYRHSTKTARSKTRVKTRMTAAKKMKK